LAGATAVLLHGRVPRGARPDEQDVLVEAGLVEGALQALGYRTVRVSLSLDLRQAALRLRRAAPRFVFNLVESVEGEDRLLYLAGALLDSLGLPFTGCPTEALFLAASKLSCKRLLAGGGVATPAWIAVEQLAGGDPPFPPPYIVKSVWEHASQGLRGRSVVQERSELRAALAELPEGRGPEPRGRQHFVEAYVEGREINLSLLQGSEGVRVLPPAEIRFLGYPEGKPRIVDYAAKWEQSSPEYRNTPRSFEFGPEDGELLKRLQQTALSCFRLLGLAGYARVDFRVDPAGRPWVLEVNTNPCLSPEAGFMAAAAQAGLSPEQVVERIVASCLGGGSGAGRRAGQGRPPSRGSFVFRREVVPGDRQAVRELLESSGYFYPEEVEVAVELVEERLARGDASGYQFLLAETGGGEPGEGAAGARVAGYSCFGPIPATRGGYDLYWIAVHEEFRRERLGTELLQRSEEIIRAQGGRRIYVETSGRAQYEPTRTFYRSRGYREEAALEDFYGPGDAKIIYLKELEGER
jgi:D-alanine-D-alanine ligase